MHKQTLYHETSKQWIFAGVRRPNTLSHWFSCEEEKNTSYAAIGLFTGARRTQHFFRCLFRKGKIPFLRCSRPCQAVCCYLNLCQGFRFFSWFYTSFTPVDVGRTPAEQFVEISLDANPISSCVTVVSGLSLKRRFQSRPLRFDFRQSVINLWLEGLAVIP
jgi:hypothetical protein